MPLVSTSRLRIGLAAAGILAVSAAALVFSPSPDGRGAGLSPNGAAAEYTREIEELDARGFTLAPDWQWPADGLSLESTGPDGAPMTYEKGYGAVQADRYWFYSWASQAVDGCDLTEQRRAIEQLRRVRDTLFYREKLPEDQAYTDQIVERAARGDLTMLREWVLANAPSEPQREAQDGP